MPGSGRKSGWSSTRAGESRRLLSYAGFGKSLLPLPVLRWSKGQFVNQNLLDFQDEYCGRILEQAPETSRVLVCSGDALFLSKDRFQSLPEADVVVFGLWVEADVASRHGVFFSRRETPGDLAFVRQKPRVEELQHLSSDYLYLMDSGIVLLSERAVAVLMKRSGWDPASGDFGTGGPRFYDLYADMLAAFGSERSGMDKEMDDLSVRLHPLQDGEFYHFGSNPDLIGFTLKLQNRVIDQRLHLERSAPHHPSVFLQNSRVGVQFGSGQHHIWIENSVVPSTWTLRNRHILTGIPENEWTVDLPEGVCVNVLPLKDGRFGLQLYGFDDSFKETLGAGMRWMGQDLGAWMRRRGMDLSAFGLPPETDALDLPLFPAGRQRHCPVCCTVCSMSRCPQSPGGMPRV
ncbi:MAG: L-fucokinase [Bacteroidales bacterium]